MKRIVNSRLAILAILTTISCGYASGETILKVSTRYASARIDEKGFIDSLTSRESGKEYSPAGHPSPLMSLHEYGKPYSQLVAPVSALYHSDSQLIALKYPNGAVATVKAQTKETYLRFQLLSLTPRGDVDNIVWGPLHTTVSGKIGDILGVVRIDDWAIGMLGLDDNTIAGPPVDGDCYGMGYYIHSPDPAKYPVPAQYHEGQRLGIGGDGVNDVAYFSHPEEYFQQVWGTGAVLEPDFGSTVAYHSRDRRKPYSYLYSLLPGFPRFRPRHVVSDPIPGVDFIGSAIALYACPDDKGLSTLESIILAEGLPHPMFDGKWIRDPASFQPDLFWGGPVDKEIEYATALGLKHLSRDTGEFYPNIDRVHGAVWRGNVGFADGHTMGYKDFAAEAAKHGMTHGGLHTLTMFLQGGISNDVTPVPSEHLQTVCRTKLAKDISPGDTEIEVTDPSFLADKGTYPWGDGSNFLRIGGEMLRYEGVSDTPPYILKGVKRGHASKAVAHKAGDELVKLQQNCYNGFVPDMTLMLDYADYYAKLMAENGMQAIGFDGFESTVEMDQGYYGVRRFLRRFFETYGKLTGGKAPRMSPSCLFAGGWEYMNSCNLGGGSNMFDPIGNRWGIEGKDIRNGFENSYFPGTFGLQNYNSEWSQYNAENLEAKSVGWDCTYSFVLSQAAVEQSGEKDGIFKTFRAWENARAAGAFTARQKLELQDMTSKFHLEQTGDKSFVLYPIKEIRIADSAGNDTKPVAIANPDSSQPLQFALQVNGAVAGGCVIALPDGSRIKTDTRMEPGQFILCKGNQAYVADKFRKKIADLPMTFPAVLPMGDSKIGVQFPASPGNVSYNLTVWISGKGDLTGT